MDEPVRFLASFPPIQSAIKLDGRDGARIQLDIPETEMAKFIKAIMWKGHRLLITIEPADNLTDLDDEIKKEPESKNNRVDRRRLTDR